MLEKVKTPSTWEKIKLGEICQIIRGASPRPMGDPKYFTGTIPFLKIADITRVPGKVVFDSNTKVNPLGAEKSRLLKKGALILTNSASVCIPKFLGNDACIHDGFVSFQNFTRETNLHFLYYYFDYVRPIVIQNNRQGVTQVNLNIEIIKNFDLLLPPILEQDEIIKKIEELLSELDKGIENLKTAQQQLKVYRQAVLKWAFEGKLTNENVKDGELPKGWMWKEFGQLFSESPQNGLYKSSTEYGSGTPIIRIDGFYEGKMVYNYDFKRVKLSVEEINRYLIATNDILVNRVNSMPYLGKCGLVKLLKEPTVFESNIMKIRVNIDETLPEYITLYLSSKKGFQELRKNAKHAVNQASINQTDVSNVLIPFCEKKEQIKIIEEIESRLSVCDKMEETISTSLQQAEALRQSILKRAFEGKLVKKL